MSNCNIKMSQQILHFFTIFHVCRKIAFFLFGFLVGWFIYSYVCLSVLSFALVILMFIFSNNNVEIGVECSLLFAKYNNKIINKSERESQC